MHTDMADIGDGIGNNLETIRRLKPSESGVHVQFTEHIISSIHSDYVIGLTSLDLQHALGSKHLLAETATER
jgi:hypothetical protein